eukprot:TRINITY_DN32986_c2_g1_i5.p1 TRINITY_DN32986_c2_g1~~TRINITY_DN32986_c2_g1_i5.p1  ORF type:complete len:583 (+),score=28.50 TRINITY_DN32986_c2_g1_i5:181-1749(+)
MKWTRHGYSENLIFFNGNGKNNRFFMNQRTGRQRSKHLIPKASKSALSGTGILGNVTIVESIQIQRLRLRYYPFFWNLNRTQLENLAANEAFIYATNSAAAREMERIVFLQTARLPISSFTAGFSVRATQQQPTATNILIGGATPPSVTARVDDRYFTPFCTTIFITCFLISVTPELRYVLGNFVSQSGDHRAYPQVGIDMLNSNRDSQCGPNKDIEIDFDQTLHRAWVTQCGFQDTYFDVDFLLNGGLDEFLGFCSVLHMWQMENRIEFVSFKEITSIAPLRSANKTTIASLIVSGISVSFQTSRILYLAEGNEYPEGMVNKTHAVLAGPIYCQRLYYGRRGDGNQTLSRYSLDNSGNLAIKTSHTESDAMVFICRYVGGFISNPYGKDFKTKEKRQQYEKSRQGKKRDRRRYDSKESRSALPSASDMDANKLVRQQKEEQAKPETRSVNEKFEQIFTPELKAAFIKFMEDKMTDQLCHIYSGSTTNPQGWVRPSGRSQSANCSITAKKKKKKKKIGRAHV